MTKKQTGDEAAESASTVLRDGRTSEESKKAAASALSQAGEGGQDRRTSAEAASSASDVLQDASTGKNSKSAAASALSQREE